ncbi:ACT domain-containing protein [Salinimonas sediminis]|uniref:ACT domain-containing protein n=1 Tax=Salinimonas sediminis TaxID=2303538 RepID=A0A346NKV2_9ALTE|nr:ACT domain-containing protein [Salinimonas sediminis]AXR06159.1 ACT domain-containing protein [Salinimonas sediminis]
MAIQTLAVLPRPFTIYAMDPDAVIPAQVLASDLFFIGRTPDQLSIILPDTIPLAAQEQDNDWRALELLGSLELSMVGIMAKIGEVLAATKVSIFVLSTFDTDFFLVKNNKLDTAVNALQRAGYTVVNQ